MWLRHTGPAVFCLAGVCSVLLLGSATGASVGYWRFESQDDLFTSMGGGPALIAVGAGVTAGDPAGPGIVPRTGEPNTGGVVDSV
jgi:hypothetical protein